MEADSIDCIWIEALFNKSKPLVVGHVYRPPDTSDYLPEDLNEKFETMFEKVSCEEKKPYCWVTLTAIIKKNETTGL